MGEIRRLRGDTRGTDFRGCSGCQYLTRVAFLLREEQDALLARAAEPTPITLENGVQGVLVPFGLAAPTEYDHCLIITMNYEIRVKRADYEALTPAQIIAITR